MTLNTLKNEDDYFPEHKHRQGVKQEERRITRQVKFDAPNFDSRLDSSAFLDLVS